MPNNYIDNKKFYQAIVERKTHLREAKKKKLPKPALSNYIGECLLLIATNLAHLPKFANYPHLDEMVGDGIENCCLYFDNYDMKYKNPHAYFTQICYWAFVRRIKKEKKALYARYKLHEQIGVLGNMEGVNQESLSRQFQVYENISDFIKTYEEKAKEERTKLADRKAQKANVRTTRKAKSSTTRKPRLRIKAKKRRMKRS